MGQAPNSEITAPRHFEVYVDETGQTPYYNDEQQPLMLLLGVITDKKNCEFEANLRPLLKKFNLDENTEIHTAPLIGGEAPFTKLNNEQRLKLLFEFVKIGVKHIDYYHSGSMLKPFKRTKERDELKNRNLDPYLSKLLYFVTSLDFFSNSKLNASYSIYFDSSSDFNKRTKRMILELCKPSEKHYFLKRLIGEPVQIDSKDNRFIQLADAICYIQARYDQMTTETFKGKKKFFKHRQFLEKCHGLFASKLISVFESFPLRFEEFLSNRSPYLDDFKKVTCDWEDRDFNHMGKWLPKKRKPDIFRHDVNISWETKNKEVGQLIDKIDVLVKRISIPAAWKIGKNEAPLRAEVLILCLAQYKEVLLDTYKEYTDLPNIKNLVVPIDNTITKYKTKYAIHQESAAHELIEISEKIMRKAGLIPATDDKIMRQLNSEDNEELNTHLLIYKALKNLMKDTNDYFLRIDKNLNKTDGINENIYRIKEPEKIEQIKIILNELEIKLDTHLRILTDLSEQKVPSLMKSPETIKYTFLYQKNCVRRQLIKLISAFEPWCQNLNNFKKFLGGFLSLSRDLEFRNGDCIMMYTQIINTVNNLHRDLKKMAKL